MFVAEVDAVDLKQLVALMKVSGALQKTALHEASDPQSTVLVLDCSTLRLLQKLYKPITNRRSLQVGCCLRDV